MIAQDSLVHMRGASPSRSPAEGSVRVLATGIIAVAMVEGARARIRAKDQRGRGQRGM